ncbi:uncharacterized protein A4U43_C02F14600 [Asparagus officinalis]|uniref:Uncharacterized protein n=1 Tax=Asparagus officinalis TaxID=4686 RepID=A0A5P1FJ65_ASPOF|nr:uncharacterized protein A4U43_C02F14600 [Asparagus officinalis]
MQVVVEGCDDVVAEGCAVVVAETCSSPQHKQMNIIDGAQSPEHAFKNSYGPSTNFFFIKNQSLDPRINLCGLDHDGLRQSKIESEESVTRCKDRQGVHERPSPPATPSAPHLSLPPSSSTNTAPPRTDYAHSEADLFAQTLPPHPQLRTPPPRQASCPSTSYVVHRPNARGVCDDASAPVDAPLAPPPPLPTSRRCSGREHAGFAYTNSKKQPRELKLRLE